MVKLNGFRTQWRKNMKMKVVVDVIYVHFDMRALVLTVTYIFYRSLV